MKSYRHLAVTDSLKSGWWLRILRELVMVACYWEIKDAIQELCESWQTLQYWDLLPRYCAPRKIVWSSMGWSWDSMVLIIIIMYRWYRIASALHIAKGKYVCSLKEHDTLSFRLFKITASDAHYPAEISNTVRKQENRNRRKMWGGKESTSN